MAFAVVDRVRVNAFHEQCGNLKLARLGMEDRIEIRSKRSSRDAKGQVRSQMRHKVAADEVFFGHGVHRQPRVLNRAESEKNFPARWHFNAPFDALTFCPDSG